MYYLIMLYTAAMIRFLITMDSLLLLSGNDIPFPEAQLIVHQPTLKEIAYIGEDSFFSGCEVLNFSKNLLPSKDRVNLENKTDFDIIMSIMIENSLEAKKKQIDVLLVLTLLFPNYSFKIDKETFQIMLIKEDEVKQINNKNFKSFQDIIVNIFCLKNKEEEYNPKGAISQKIADKLKEREQKLAKIKQQDNEKIAFLSRYISILAVGEQKDLNTLMNYTIYQLFDEWERFCLKMNYDAYVKAKMFGAKNLEEVENWMKDIHA